jgi:hypothetical protein
MRYPFHAIMIGLLICCSLSCSVSRRHYRKGLHVEWRKSKTFTPGARTATSKDQEVIASANAKVFLCAAGRPDEECDVIMLKAGSEIEVKITEVTLTEIKYRACDNVSGKTKYYRCSEVFMIKYANGIKQVLGKDAPLPGSRTVTATINHGHTSQNLDYSKAGSVPSGTSSSEKVVPGAAKAGLFFGILSLFLFFTIIVPLLGLIFSASGATKIDKEPAKYRGKGMANWGAVLSFLGLLAGVIILILLLIG